MRKRVLSFLLAASAAFCFIRLSAPEAQAIVPIGFVQSALASYVSSTGYKLYNDNGTGQDILGSLGDLYDDYVTVSNKTITGQLANLAFLANSPYIYQDNSGQIVVSKVAADIFQDFADWIQTEYSVTVGSDTPVQVVAPSSGSISAVDDRYTASDRSDYFYYNIFSFPLVLSDSSASYTYESGGTVTRSVSSGTAYGCIFQGTSYYRGPLFVSDAPFTVVNGSGSPDTVFTATSKSGVRFYYSYESGDSVSYIVSSTFTNAVSDSLYSLNQEYLASDLFTVVYGGQLSESAGIASLGVTLAQAVADVVGQAKEDDAVVIGVGAGVGATAQDIADMVAQGVKAQTLDPSVSITAEAVIDTPVQPYPDIDGLGLPTLGAALVDRFPFCIPWDFVDTVKLLSADPQPINIKVDLIPQRIKTSVGITSDTSFDIDLSGEQYAKIGVFCRWGSLITFCFGLFLLTKRLVWTA